MEFRPKAKRRECFLECDINVDENIYLGTNLSTEGNQKRIEGKVTS